MKRMGVSQALAFAVVAVVGISCVNVSTGDSNVQKGDEGVAKATASDRGFGHRSAITRGLKDNPLTAAAPERVQPNVQVFALAEGDQDIGRNSETAFEVVLPEAPIMARFAAKVWHQGTDAKPMLVVNGREVGTLETSPVSLADRNFVVFVFDNQWANGAEYQLDYQGWQEAQFFIDHGDLRAGSNQLVLTVGTDQIVLRDPQLEVLTAVDAMDSVHDFRSEENRGAAPGL